VAGHHLKVSVNVSIHHCSYYYRELLFIFSQGLGVLIRKYLIEALSLISWVCTQEIYETALFCTVMALGYFLICVESLELGLFYVA